jgi:hypothetical protein
VLVREALLGADDAVQVALHEVGHDVDVVELRRVVRVDPVCCGGNGGVVVWWCGGNGVVVVMVV